MSGHNKWTQIKRQKAKTDGQKSKTFSKFARLITQEAKHAKGNLSDPSLRATIEKARSFNMPNENIDRAIKKATEANTATLESITYEAYGPGGCALIIEALTDNRNKAAQEIKHILSDHGIELASIGSAMWAFKKSSPTAGGMGGGISWEPQTMIAISPEDLVMLEKIINDLEENDEVQEVFTNAE
jgi:YebC/PmpR family DNA-binding regulatory protein